MAQEKNHTWEQKKFDDFLGQQTGQKATSTTKTTVDVNFLHLNVNEKSVLNALELLWKLDRVQKWATLYVTHAHAWQDNLRNHWPFQYIYMARHLLYEGQGQDTMKSGSKQNRVSKGQGGAVSERTVIAALCFVCGGQETADARIARERCAVCGEIRIVFCAWA